MRNSIKWTLVALSLAGFSCGSNSKDLSKFIGVWGAPAGITTTTCTGLGTSTEQVTGTETWAASSTSDLAMTLAGTNCVFHANVSGNTATAVSGQTCSITGTDTNGIAYTETMTVTSYNFVVSSDGKTALETVAATASYIEAGVTVPCTVTETATTYTKQ